MARLRIVAAGTSEGARADARGKLFEGICREILRRYGYEIETCTTMHAGMEVDIEGQHKISRNPVYAECKCYASDIDSPKIQAFAGKYFNRWQKDERAESIFLAIPGLNSSAMGYYKDTFEGNNKFPMKLLQEPDVIQLLSEAQLIVSEQEIDGKVDKAKAEPGDSLLICSDKGYFWLKLIIPHGSGIANSCLLFDGKGRAIGNQSTVDYLSGVVPELSDFALWNVEPRDPCGSEEDNIVELRGSSACFEYQFPAAPEFFVGRGEVLDEVMEFADEIIEKETTCRGLLFSGNSGWGKSSAVLAIAERLRKDGHYAIAIDSRCANSSRFVLSLVRYIADTFGDFDGLAEKVTSVGGFQGALDALVQIGDKLKCRDKLLFVFMDQFESVFSLQDLLHKLTTMLLRVTDKATNVVLSFAWKTDLFGMTQEFPYKLRDSISDSCKSCNLIRFTEVETNLLLDKLAHELHNPVRRDLRFFLSEFSQGYPWLLKKLCAHVKNQRAAGVSQADIAKGLLNVEQLFQEDVQGLTAVEHDTLKRIAKASPVQALDISDDLNKDVIQSLIDRRLVVKVGTKYDIYWDIFRDYLNTGRLPVQEVYLLRANIGSCIRSLKMLNQEQGEMTVERFKAMAKLSDGSYFNVLRDLRLLGLVESKGKKLRLCVDHATDEKRFSSAIAQHVAEKLKRNHGVDRILRLVAEKGEVALDEVAADLRAHLRYVSAKDETWKIYSRIVISWLDFVDLAIYNVKSETVSKYDPSSQIREKTLTFARRRRKSSIPTIQFQPVLQIAEEILKAVRNKTPVDWSGFRKTTILKSLRMLEEMRLIERTGKSITLCSGFYKFVEERGGGNVARDILMGWPYFREFVSLLKEHQNAKITHDQLAAAFIGKTRVSWAQETTKTHVKIMLDWARHVGLAPGRFACAFKGAFKKDDVPEATLFDAE